MKMALIAGFALVVSSQAMALHYFDCSNPTASVQVAEHEIWGSNPVGCIYKGEVVKDGKVTLFTKTKKSIQLEGDKKTRIWEETFAIHARLSSKKGLPEPVTTQQKTSVDTWLLCHEKSTAELDLVAPKAHCEVEFK